MSGIGIGSKVILSLFWASYVNGNFDNSLLCPKFCVCDIWYQLNRASCTGRHLYSIHTGVGGDVQALDLSNNSVSSLNSFELMNSGLVEVKYLNLSGNAISEISLNAFSGLDRLMVLDISRNHLRYVLRDVIADNRELQILKLSGNNFDSDVPKIWSPWLTTLNLDGCKIDYLPEDTFNELTRLRNLDLSNNLMIQVDSVTFRPLPFLRTLSLEGNPWSCNKPMLELESELRHRGVQYTKFCGKLPKNNVPLEKLQRMILPDPKQPKEVMGKGHRTPEIQGRTENVSRKVSESSYARFVHRVPPYWFLGAGFILGTGCGVFFCYVWLTGKCLISCRRRNIDNQRLSLLSSLYLEEARGSFRGNLRGSCPGTPPPPYREVMLRPGLYRCTS